MSSPKKVRQFAPRISEGASRTIEKFCDDNLLKPNSFIGIVLERVALKLDERKAK